MYKKLELGRSGRQFRELQSLISVASIPLGGFPMHRSERGPEVEREISVVVYAADGHCKLLCSWTSGPACELATLGAIVSSDQALGWGQCRRLDLLQSAEKVLCIGICSSFSESIHRSVKTSEQTRPSENDSALLVSMHLYGGRGWGMQKATPHPYFPHGNVSA